MYSQITAAPSGKIKGGATAGAVKTKRGPVYKIKNAQGETIYKGPSLGAAMLKYERANGHQRRLPRMGVDVPTGVCDITRAIPEVMIGKMSPTTIAHLVSEKLGRTVATQTISDRLRGSLSSRVEREVLGPRKYLWELKQQ